MDKDDDEENNLPIWNLSTTNGKENDETEDPINPDKPLFRAAEKIETALPSPISSVPIDATKARVFQVLQYLLVYNQFLYQGNHRQWKVTKHFPELRLMVEILTRL